MAKKITPSSHRVHVYYTGRVQGIGFRYTAERLALDLHLTGWVKNLPDGRVELVCEGSKDKIDQLLENIQKSTLGLHIKKSSLTWEKPTQEFSDFSVEFCL